MNKAEWNIGFYSSLFTTLFAILYIISQLIIGIDMPETQKDQFFILLPSLFLAPSFLIMVVSVHSLAEAERKIWSHIGIVFATAYFIFVSIIYLTELTVTLPHTLAGNEVSVDLLRYVPKKFLTGVYALGYTCMSLSTLFAAGVFYKERLEFWIKRFFVLNGILAPIILLTNCTP
ncbi:MAG: hypothetical protein SH818_10315 [Saprospiraceae bacterium]|nr:hypothetical protein [Saprospiraceae bacterium]